MLIGTGRHLGQVGHASTWRARAELLHQPAHGLGHGAAHARIDLVKDQRGRLAQLAGGDRDGQRMRESSPPEATLPTGRGVMPGWLATRKAT